MTASFGHHIPGGAASVDIISLLLRIVRYRSGIPLGISRQIKGHHGQAGGTTAGVTDQAASVALIAPADIPLQQQRDFTGGGLRAQVNFRGLIPELGILIDILQRLRIFLRQLLKVLRIDLRMIQNFL